MMEKLFGSKSVTVAPSLRLAPCLMLVLTLCVAGCAAPKAKPADLAESVPIAGKDATREAEKRQDLEAFLRFFQATVERGAMTVERKAETDEQRRGAILWRTRMMARMQSAASDPDAREALLDVWAVSQRMFDYFESGAGKAMFGSNQKIAIAATRQIVDAAETLARKYVPEERFAAAKEQVIAYARSNPFEGDFSEKSAAELSDQEAGAKILGGVLGLSLAPLSALKSVSDTPESVRDVSKSMDRFTSVVKDLPTNTRWEAQLLAMNLEELASVSDTVASFKRLSESSSKFTQVLEDLPAKTREQADLLLTRVDESQPEIRSTLSEANSTVSNVREASAALEKAADAVTRTAGVILKFVPAEPKARQEKTEDSFSFQAVTESAVALGQTTEKLQGLLVEVRSVLDGGGPSSEATALDARIGQTLDATRLRIEGLINHAAIRTGQLLLLLFALLAGYGWLRSKVRRAPPAPG